jgi:hypothetical protein
MVVGSRRRPQAASRSSGSFRDRTPWRACSALGLDFVGAVMARNFRDPSSRGGGRWALKAHGESESNFEATEKRRSRTDARIGGSGVCPRVGSAVAEVVGRQSDPEKRSSAVRVNIANRGDGRRRGSSLR